MHHKIALTVCKAATTYEDIWSILHLHYFACKYLHYTCNYMFISSSFYVYLLSFLSLKPLVCDGCHSHRPPRSCGLWVATMRRIRLCCSVDPVSDVNLGTRFHRGTFGKWASRHKQSNNLGEFDCSCVVDFYLRVSSLILEVIILSLPLVYHPTSS